MLRQLTGRRLTAAYISALIAIASLATIDFVVQKIMLKDSDLTRRVKDIVSDQRASVQSIAFVAQSLAISERIQEKELKKAQLTEMLFTLDRSIKDFAKLKTEKIPLYDILSPLNYIEPLGIGRELEDFRDHVKALTASDPVLLKADHPDLRYLINRAQTQLLSKLDIFVTLTVSDSQNRLKSLGIVDSIAYGFVMLLLVLTGFFVFRPVVASVVDQQFRQDEATARLEERADALELSQDRLRRQTRILKSVLNTMGDALIVVDEHGRILMQNPAAESLFGYLEEGRSTEDWQMAAGLFDPETDASLSRDQDPISRAIHSQRFNDYLVKVKNAQGDQFRIFSTSGRKMIDDDSATRGAVISFHDITDRIQKEHELVDSKIRAESANISKTQFLANISHEIRTPMSAILGFADRLLANRLSTDERQSIVQVIRRNSKTLMNIIDDLLDISRVETGQLVIQNERTSLSGIVSEVFSLLTVKAQEKGLELSAEFKGSLPETITTDALRLRQVLINVVGNAIKFTAEGKITLRVFLSPTLSDQAVLRQLMAFEVSDTGCGIQAESVGQLFKPFAQVDNSTTRRFGGTGLGLNLSRRLAKALGGDLLLTKSEVGVGSTFMAYIDPGDLSQATFSEHLSIRPCLISSADTASALFPDSGLEGTRVLVVDDGEENRELFSYYLRVAGAEVTAAVDGREGVEKALNGEFDLVLMDIQMPNLDGYEALRFLRDRSYEVPVVALTAHAMKEAAERCVNAGFTAHLAKPIDARDLIAAVQRYRRGSAVHPSEQSAALSGEFPERSTSGQDYLPVTVMAIINKFREQLPTKLSELVSAAERGEFDELSRLSHKLKGAAGACGFDELVRGIEHIEESLQNSLTPELIQSRCRSLKRTFLAGGRSNSTERSLFS